jgi:hypothetical protein
MFFVQAYVENILAEHLCNGLTFSSVVDGAEQFGTPLTVTGAFQRALQHAEDGLAKVTGTTAADLRVRHALQVLRGRILMNLNRPADAATALAGVPTSFKYEMLHSATTNSNALWSFNNINRRYSVSTGEGTNGINFATAGDPRVPVCMGGDVACRAIGVTRSDRDDLTRPFYVAERGRFGREHAMTERRQLQPAPQTTAADPGQRHDPGFENGEKQFME